uniref:Uncharacterized protein n=1 Tax=viral metagenome TaxID=1070528 RepID=A0A6C0LDX5_9ZZZZ
MANLLNNKTVFYIILFLSITNIIGDFILGSYVSILLFLVVGALTYLYVKNMTVVLVVPLIISNVFMMGKRVEGMTNSDTTNTDKKTKTTSKVSSPLDNTHTTTSTAVAAAAADHSIIAPEDQEPEPMNAEVQKDGFKKRNRIDYASTIEESYGNLSQILGSDGIKGLTDDTRKLMKQQMQLAEAMKSMTPIVQQAQDMLQGLDLKNLGGIADLAKQFTGGKKD